MPTFTYRCQKCGREFERSESISEHEVRRAACPKCGSRKVSTVPRPFVVITSKKS
jgi:putative FmdB family regulatory protein